MLTYGEYPYADCATAEDVVHQVTLGGRLPRPEACSAELGTLMEKCEWQGSELSGSGRGVSCVGVGVGGRVEWEWEGE